MRRVLIDSHVHLHEYNVDYVKDRYCNNPTYIMLAVSDDYDSSIRTLNLSSMCKNVIPAVGLHPWEVNDGNTAKMHLFNRLITANVKFLGEVGLDKKFKPDTFSKQVEVFKYFLKLAKEHELGMSLHAAGAWEDVLNLIVKYDIGVAIFHWYTGPLELLKDIESLGYYIGVNAAIKIQKKALRVVEEAPLNLILTESDGPYTYRGLKLGPELIPETVDIIAKVKDMSKDEVIKRIALNFNNALKKIRALKYVSDE